MIVTSMKNSKDIFTFKGFCYTRHSAAYSMYSFSSFQNRFHLQLFTVIYLQNMIERIDTDIWRRTRKVYSSQSRRISCSVSSCRIWIYARDLLKEFYHGKKFANFSFQNYDSKNNLPYGDSTFKIIVNTTSSRKNTPLELIPFFNYVNDMEVPENDTFIHTLHCRVENFNTSE